MCTQNEHGPTQGTPATPLCRADRVDKLAFAITALIAFGVYGCTLAPNVTLEFSGLLATGAKYAGVPHPPGYPVWTFYSWLFTHLLPFSNIAWRIAVGSAVAAASACGLVAMVVSCGGRVILARWSRFAALKPVEQILLRAVCGCVAGLVLASNRAVWSKAVIVDVWALSLLMFVGVIWSLMRWMFETRKRFWLYGAFFIVGMLLTSHQEMLVMLPGAVIAILLGDRQIGRDVALFTAPLAILVTARNQYSLWICFPDQLNLPLCGAFGVVLLAGSGVAVMEKRFATEWKVALLCGTLFLLGFGCSFLSPVFSMSNPPVNWGYSRTVEGAFHLLGRGQYERLQPSAGWAEFVTQLWRLARCVAKDFGYLQSALVLLALFSSVVWRSGGRHWGLGLLVLLASVGPILAADVNPPLDVNAWTLLRPGFAPLFAVLAVWLGLGMMLFGAWVAKPNLLLRAE